MLGLERSKLRRGWRHYVVAGRDVGLRVSKVGTIEVSIGWLVDMNLCRLTAVEIVCWC